MAPPGKASSPPPAPSPPKAPAPDASSSSSSSKATPVKAAKVKEADHIKLSGMPDATSFHSWRSATPKEVAAASGVAEEAFQWIMEVEDQDATFESLRDSGAFPSLDTKLGAAISKICSGEGSEDPSRR